MTRQLPLARDGRRITRLFENLSEGAVRDNDITRITTLGPASLAAEVIDTVVAPVLPCHQHEACGMTDRRSEAGLEPDSLRAKPVKYRRLVLGIPVARQLSRSDVIGKENDDVGHCDRLDCIVSEQRASREQQRGEECEGGFRAV